MNPTFIDLFAGCGGLSLGLIHAGWRGLLAVEKSNDAFMTLRHNLIDKENFSSGGGFTWARNILEIAPHDVHEIVDNVKLASLRGRVDLIAGGPPCQGFSFLGQRTGKDPRNELFRYYLKIVDIINPKLVLMENVNGINVPFANTKNRKSINRTAPKSYATLIRQSLEEHGYHVEQGVVKSSDFGVPQLRPRFFTFGIRKDILMSIEINKSFFDELRQMREDFLVSRGLGLKYQSVECAISDLRTSDGRLEENQEEGVPKGFKRLVYKNPKTKFQKLMHRDHMGAPMNGQMDSMRLANHREMTIQRFKEIQTLCEAGKQLSVKTRECLTNPTRKSSITFLSGDKPSHTITTLPDDLIHYEEPRIHTVREYARFQSFPDWFEFRGKYTTGGHRRKNECPRYTQVGNAVPPLLAEALGECMKQVLLKSTKVHKKTLLLAPKIR